MARRHYRVSTRTEPTTVAVIWAGKRKRRTLSGTTTNRAGHGTGFVVVWVDVDGRE